MTHALLDTNIIVDIVAARQPFVETAKEVFRKLGEKKFVGYITASSITDVYYLAEKEKGRTEAALATQRIARILEILPVNREIIEKAFVSPILDFEDAVQVESAKAVGVQVIVTRNPKDLTYSHLAVFEPEEFVKYLSQQEYDHQEIVIVSEGEEQNGRIRT